MRLIHFNALHCRHLCMEYNCIGTIRKIWFFSITTWLIFEVLVAILAVAMILTGRLSEKKHTYLGYIPGLLLLSGDLLAIYSKGNYIFVFTGIGIPTGFGFRVSLKAPIQLFPEGKDLCCGNCIAA